MISQKEQKVTLKNIAFGHLQATFAGGGKIKENQYTQIFQVKKNSNLQVVSLEAFSVQIRLVKFILHH
jgi:hypothetical protein